MGALFLISRGHTVLTPFEAILLDSGELMPFKSQAQRRKFAQLLVEGKISPETYEEWNRETGSKRLPDHVKKKAQSPRKRATKSARKTPTRKRRSDIDDHGYCRDKIVFAHRLTRGLPSTELATEDRI